MPPYLISRRRVHPYQARGKLARASARGDPHRVSAQRSTGPELNRAVDAFALAGAALLAAFLLLGGDAGAARRDFPLDDAWIHLVYARNLWSHATLAYNPGVPESGASSVLWVF